MKIKQKLMVMMCVTAFLLSACDNSALTSNEQGSKGNEDQVISTQAVVSNSITDVTQLTQDPFDSQDLDNNYDKPNSVLVNLEETSITADAKEDDGVLIEGTKITITKAGQYFFTGSCGDGQIVVDTKDEKNVKLVLNGVTLTNKKGCPVYIKSAKKTIINLGGGTSNTLSDAGNYQGEEDGITAAIFSLGDLTLNGEGQLMVTGNYQDAISCTGSLKITAGTAELHAKDDALVASKGVSIKNGSFNFQCGGNGIKTTSANEQEGFIGIECGNYVITSGRDVLNAAGNVYICNGSFTGTAAGGSHLSSTDETWGNFGGEGLTAKGIKAGGDVQIHGGSITLDAADDAIYSGNNVLINTGCVKVLSGDDGIVANKDIEVNGGSVTLEKCFEGFESTNLSMNGGYVDVTATNDGINIANGNDSSASEKRKGRNEFERKGTGKLSLANTCINIRSMADAMDVAGDVEIAGGAVRMCGGSDAKAQGVDCSGNYSLQGGAIVLAGNNEMAIPKTLGQPAVSIQFKEKQPANSAVCIKNSKKEVVFAFCMGTEYDKVLVSQSIFKKGDTYSVYKASLTDSEAAVFGDVQESSLLIGDKVQEIKITDGVVEVK